MKDSYFTPRIDLENTIKQKLKERWSWWRVRNEGSFKYLDFVILSNAITEEEIKRLVETEKNKY